MGTLTSLDEDILVIGDHPSDSGVVSESLPSADGNILVISAGSPLDRATGLRWRAVRVLGLGGATAVAALILIFAIIGPAVRESRRQQCVKDLGQIGLAFYEYQRVRGHLPAPALADRDGRPLLSWRVAILPELGYASLYARFHLDEPWDSPHNRALLREMPTEFACPGGPGPRAGRTGYLVVVGPKSEEGSVNTPFEPARGGLQRVPRRDVEHDPRHRDRNPGPLDETRGRAMDAGRALAPTGQPPRRRHACRLRRRVDAVPQVVDRCHDTSGPAHQERRRAPRQGVIRGADAGRVPAWSAVSEYVLGN